MNTQYNAVGLAGMNVIAAGIIEYVQNVNGNIMDLQENMRSHMNRRGFIATIIGLLVTPFIPKDKFWRYHCCPINISTDLGRTQIWELGRQKPYWKYPTGDITESITYYGEQKVWIP